MKSYGVNELRGMFLDFFRGKGHLVMNSFSLIPQNDNSLLLINAGMAPLKSYFTGAELPPKARVATCQKCVRTGDIENVGKTDRHLTFFEMLGNFSFGDYFKREAITWSWEFLTETVGLDARRLYPSVYGEDAEAFRIWTEDIGISPDRIARFYRDPETGECDNFWEHGAGPCGPSSEIYYDRGEKYGCGKPNCKVGCECDRYMEVWNNVFTQFNGDGCGTYRELETKNIDTGMGLERLAVIAQDVDSVFEIDTMRAIRDRVCDLCGRTYQPDTAEGGSVRVVTDHIRSAVFMVSDGILPSNERRGYVLRRVIRRAARHGKMLGINDPFLSRVAQVVISGSGNSYPELAEKENFILDVLTREEERFARTLDQGLAILDEMENEMEERGERTLTGANAFKLYDTFGFPIDLTSEILAEKGFSYDEAAFREALEMQRKRARGSRKETNYSGHETTAYDAIDPTIISEFIGYKNLNGKGKVAALVSISSEEGKADVAVDKLTGKTAGAIITDVTPFYATMGGQAGDHGTITASDGEFDVTDTIPIAGGRRIAHVGRMLSGTISVGDEASLRVDKNFRAATCRNHSATHLLHSALRIVLGTHVEQSGSYQDAERTRFDFSHFRAMTSEELTEVEQIVNARIAEAIPVTAEVMTAEEAKSSGAMALFGEKYGNEVRVVSMGDFSKELCGGTHVANTADIMAFKIISEGGVASGVRRVEALTGRNVFSYYEKIEEELCAAAKAAKAQPTKLADRIMSMQSQLKTLLSENESLKSKIAQSSVGDITNDVADVNGVKLLARSVPDLDMNGLRDLGDQLREKLGEGVILLASTSDDKVSLVAMATDGATQKGVHAGNLIRVIAKKIGGGGGGRPNIAQAGGKNPDGIPNAIAAAKDVLTDQIRAN